MAIMHFIFLVFIVSSSHAVLRCALIYMTVFFSEMFHNVTKISLENYNI